jgi:hypothetical protein
MRLEQRMSDSTPPPYYQQTRAEMLRFVPD